MKAFPVSARGLLLENEKRTSNWRNSLKYHYSIKKSQGNHPSPLSFYDHNRHICIYIYVSPLLLIIIYLLLLLCLKLLLFLFLLFIGYPPDVTPNDSVHGERLLFLVCDIYIYLCIYIYIYCIYIYKYILHSSPRSISLFF